MPTSNMKRYRTILSHYEVQNFRKILYEEINNFIGNHGNKKIFP